MKLTRLLIIASISCFVVAALSATQPESADSLRAETEQLGQELQSLASECTELFAHYEEAEGEARILAWTILSRRGAEAEEKLAEFVEDVATLREQGQPVEELQRKAEEALAVGFLIMQTDIQRRRDSFAELLGQLPELPLR